MFFFSSIEAKNDGCGPFLAFALNTFAVALNISAAILKNLINTQSSFPDAYPQYWHCVSLSKALKMMKRLKSRLVCSISLSFFRRSVLNSIILPRCFDCNSIMVFRPNCSVFAIFLSLDDPRILELTNNKAKINCSNIPSTTRPQCPIKP